MQVHLNHDIAWQSKIDHAVKFVDFHAFFEERNYGAGLTKLVLFLICQEPALMLKQRVRLVKATSILYVDIMLDLPYFIQASHVERRRKIANEIREQVQAVLVKRRIRDFDLVQFMSDLIFVSDDQLNGEFSTRFDEYCLERASGY